MSTALAHKIALDPTPEQRNFFERAAGTARFTWNWALAEWQERYQLGGKPKGHLLKKSFNALRRVQFPWTYEVHRDATARPFADLQNAFINFWEGRANYPTFKKKGKCRDSLGERLFLCDACGYIEDRDVNAAKNINQLGQAMPEVTPVESRALVLVPASTQLNSQKQERTRAHFCAGER